MAFHANRIPLWPKMEDMDPGRTNVPLTRLKETGAYQSWTDLFNIHTDLQVEDYLCAISDQINKIRADPALLQEDVDCYFVTGSKVVTKPARSGKSYVVGTEFKFDTLKYLEVEWDEEKRLMRNNVVFLTQDDMQTFLFGVISESGDRLLKQGRLVVQIAEGLDDQGYPRLLPQELFVGEEFYLVDGTAFHFPHQILTKTLSTMSVVGLLRKSVIPFYEEIVRSQLPSKRPEHLEPFGSTLDQSFVSVCESLNRSQIDAVTKVLQYRVALVQGPPGTGKTFLGVKVAELFVKLKKTRPELIPGPILVVTASNHAVQEFLLRCKTFSNKVIHCCSNQHNRGEATYGDLQREHDRAQHRNKPDVLRRADIIGMTTTRGACLRADLQELQIHIVIVEEAAEVLEAHVLACIPRTAKHLIMIGDHRQLQPSGSHQPLVKEYRLNLSMFERLVNNGADVPMLSEQRRMRPSIANLVRNVYPNLTDHVTTLGRPRLKGIDLKEPVYFFNHNFDERELGKSYMNTMEAEVAVELAAYLIQRGYAVETITILTTYRRQLRLLKQLIEGHKCQKMLALRATTVDSFQGEENDIIILSLVRSNASGKIGFLKMANRATVALTRARNGFFILGNFACMMASGVPVWTHVERELLGARPPRVGPALPLECPEHSGVRFLARSADHIRAAMGRRCLCAGPDAVADALRALSLDTR